MALGTATALALAATAAGGVASSAMASSAQDRANASNRSIADANLQRQTEFNNQQRADTREQNLYQRGFAEDERAYQRRIYDENRRRELEGSTDGDGNTTRYIPGEGWVTTKSESTRQLDDAKRGATLQAALSGGKAFRMADAASERQEPLVIKGENIINQILESLGNQEYNKTSIKDALTKTRRDAVNESFDKTQAPLLMQALRGGNSNTRAIEKLAKARSDSLLQATGNVDTEAAAAYEQLQGSKEGRAGSLISALMGKGASAPGGFAGYDTQSGSLAQAMKAGGGTSAAPGSRAGQEFGMRGGSAPQLNYQVTPNMNLAQIPAGLANTAMTGAMLYETPYSSDGNGGFFNIFGTQLNRGVGNKNVGAR